VENAIMPETDSDARVTTTADGSNMLREGLLAEGADITNPDVYVGVRAGLLVASKLLLGLEHSDRRLTAQAASAVHEMLASAVKLAEIARTGPGDR
jgi:hypothetical protein